MSPNAQRHERENGSALIWALIFVVVTSGMIISHTAYMAANRREMDVLFRQSALATSLAHSGLTDALAWFRRQPNQPVTAFGPAYDPGGDPPVLDTIDPVLGLVREFEVRGDLWGRYEVRHAEVGDISQQRSSVAVGSVWEVGARGVLYDRKDPGKAYDEPPNQIVATTAISTEIRGIPLVPPAPAAVCVEDLSRLTVYTKGTIEGLTNAAVAYAPAMVFPLFDGTITGSPATLPLAGYDATPEKVFSMPLDDLRALSDYIVPGGGLPPPSIGPYRVVYVNGDLVLSTPLYGRMLLVVRGNLTALAGNNSRITGLVYVAGNAVIDGPFKLKGTIVVRGTLKIGNGPDAAEFSYDGALMDRLRRELMRYRLSKAFVPR